MKKVRLAAPALIGLIALIAGSLMMVQASDHDETFYACLYAGSLSQVNTTAPPTNCGRGAPVSWNSEGIQGEPGTDGVSGFERESVVIPIPGNTSYTTYSLDCEDTSKVAIAGGFRPSHANVEVMSSFPGNPEYRWNVRARNTHTDEQTLTIYSSCVDLAEPEL